MDADLRGCLEHIDRSYRAFEHKDMPMSKREVQALLEYGISKGYTSLSEIKDEEIDEVLKSLKS